MIPDVENAMTGGHEFEEIEVTPEMIKAGVIELSLSESSDPWSATVVAIYRAMVAACRAPQVLP